MKTKSARLCYVHQDFMFFLAFTSLIVGGNHVKAKSSANKNCVFLNRSKPPNRGFGWLYRVFPGFGEFYLVLWFCWTDRQSGFRNELAGLVLTTLQSTESVSIYNVISEPFGITTFEFY